MIERSKGKKIKMSLTGAIKVAINRDREIPREGILMS